MKEYINDLVSNFKTTHDWGFTSDEIDTIFNTVHAEYHDMNIHKAYNSLNYDTCMEYNGEVIRYHQDVKKALFMSFEK